jgi:amphi-Trp domain-containing protein
MARRSDRDLERTYSRAQFAAKLRRLADAIEAGRPFTIQVAGEPLRIPADAVFNVEHERAAGAEELEFQLRWAAERRGGANRGRRRNSRRRNSRRRNSRSRSRIGRGGARMRSADRKKGRR